MDDRLAVRRARATDLDSLVSLFEEYRAFYRCAPDEARARAFLEQRLRRGDSTILLATDERLGAAGFVQLYPVFSSLRMAPALILNDLYVRPAFRRRGVARVLMEAARELAEGSGAVALTLETATDNAGARALYESLGYRLESGFLQYSLTTGASGSTR